MASSIIFALASTGDGIALRSEETSGSAQIDGAVDGAGRTEVDWLTDGVGFASASTGLVVATSAVTTTTAEATHGIVRTADIAARSSPERIANAFTFLGVPLNASAFTLDTLMTRFADVTEIGEVTIANASGASFSCRVVVANIVVAVTVVSVTSAANVAGFASPAEEALASAVTIVTRAAHTVTGADVISDAGTFELAGTSSITIDAIAEDLSAIFRVVAETTATTAARLSVVGRASCGAVVTGVTEVALTFA